MVNVKEYIEEHGYEDVTVFDSPSYDAAFVGMTSDGRAVYDFEKMVQCLVDDGMEAEEAVEFIEFNTLRALTYFQNAPVVLYPIDE